jgi:hypothetical protein
VFGAPGCQKEHFIFTAAESRCGQPDFAAAMIGDAEVPAGKMEDGSRSVENSACLPRPNLAGSLTALVNRYENKN